MSNLIGLIEMVQAVEAQQFWAYIAVVDAVTCERCLQFDQGLMTRREIEGTFPYLDQYSETVWFPNTHPNCRCALTLFEEDVARNDDGDIIKTKDNVVEVTTNNGPSQSNEAPLTVKDLSYTENEQQPTTPTPGVPLEPQANPDMLKLSDTNFKDWLEGLLNVGVIAAEVYDLVTGRKKKKEEQTK